MHCILFHDVVDGFTEKRAPLRNLHLQYAQAAFDRGELVLAGALAEPVDGAILVFRDAEAVERFAQPDPYVLNGMVTKWRARKWSTVIGDGANLP